MRRNRWHLAALCGLAASALPAFALAQTEPLLPVPALPTGPQPPVLPGQPVLRGQTVTDRPRPEYDPLGIHAGSYFFFPRAEVGEMYNDNIFATSGDKKSDLITILAPSFDLLSNFPRNALNVHGGASIGTYASHSHENYQDAFGTADGRYDITTGDHLTGALGVHRLHEDRTSPDAPGNTSEPTRFNTYNGRVGYVEDGLRFGYSADAAVERDEYESAPLIGGGTVQQSFRNVTSYELALRGSYTITPRYQVFVRGAGNIRNHDHSAPGFPTQDSHGFRVDTGMHVEVTGITFADVYVGYLRQDYRSASFGSISGIDVGGNLTWNATTLTTVKLNAERTVQDSNQLVTGLANSPGYLHSVAGVSVDHELLRNVLLNANASYANDDFQGINRTDDVYTAGVGAKYLLNRHLYLGATYSFQHRSSSGTDAINPFSQNIFMLRLSTQL